MRRRPAPPLLLPRKRKAKAKAEVSLDTYILQGRVVKRCLDYELWERWIDYPDDRCVVDVTEFDCDGTVVRTRFLGIDVAMEPSHGPLLFETSVEGGECNGFRALWKTWVEADAGHVAACQLVRDTYQ